MRGRPKLEDSRDNQYRVRLNNEENHMLDYASKLVGKTKADIFRIALLDYYNNIRLNEINLLAGDEDIWNLNTICLKRVVKCPYCQNQQRVDLSDECLITTNDCQMGEEKLYEFDYKESCNMCLKPFDISGSISEYPVGTLNYENVKIFPIEL